MCTYPHAKFTLHLNNIQHLILLITLRFHILQIIIVFFGQSSSYGEVSSKSGELRHKGGRGRKITKPARASVTTWLTTTTTAAAAAVQGVVSETSTSIFHIKYCLER